MVGRILMFMWSLGPLKRNRTLGRAPRRTTEAAGGSRQEDGGGPDPLA